MVWLIGIVAFIVIVMILLLFYVKVSLKYVYSTGKKRNIFEVKVFGIVVYKGKKKKEKPPAEEKLKKKKITYEDFKTILRNWKTEKACIKERTGKLFCNLKKLVKVKKIGFKLDMGFGDAAKTGMGAGAAYGVLYGIFSGLYNFFKMKGKSMDVCINPDFSNERIDLVLNVSLSVRLIFLIPALLNLSKIVEKLTKETKLLK